MSFIAGTTIEVTEKQEDWWQGRAADGKEGWFPSNRVEEKQKKIKATKKAPPPPAAPIKTVEATNPEPIQTVQTPTGEPMKAAYDFDGQQETDLRYQLRIKAK